VTEIAEMGLPGAAGSLTDELDPSLDGEGDADQEASASM
jgi:hypothetical protein